MRYLQVLVNGLATGSIYGLAALGFNLIYGTTKIFHVAYGSVIMIALYFVTSISLNAHSLDLRSPAADLQHPQPEQRGVHRQDRH